MSALPDTHPDTEPDTEPDTALPGPAVDPGESRRLAALDQLQILGSAREERFDRLTRLAQRVLGGTREALDHVALLLRAHPDPDDLLDQVRGLTAVATPVDDVTAVALRRLAAS